MTIFFREWRASLLATAGLLVVPVTASAQAIGMLQDERAVTALNGPGYEDFRNGGGVLYGGATPTSAPLQFSDSHTGGSDPAGTNASVSQSVYGNFGNLSVSTSGSSNSSGVGGGSFVWSSTYIGGDVTVGFLDYITASQNMTIDFKYILTGQSSSMGSPDGGGHANTVVYYDFNTIAVNIDFLPDFALNGTQVFEGTTSLQAGVPTLLAIGLGWDASTNTNDLNGTSGSFQMSTVGNVMLTSLTPGATFTSQSGHNYQVVPEPATVSIFGLGLLALRRKKALAA